jgi:glutathione S-transferase
MMPGRHSLPSRIYHLAVATEWRDAAEAGTPYRRSTLGKSLEEQGFIHCSFAGQVQTVADLVYAGRDDIVLLTIDPSRLQADVRLENVEGGAELFPHIYGPLPLDAVVASDDVAVAADGRLVLAPLIREP